MKEKYKKTDKKKALWSGRFSDASSTITEKISSSIHFDSRLYKQDIKGSIAHAKMLQKMGILSEEELKKIAHRVADRLAVKSLSGRTVTLKVTYADFSKTTRAQTLDRLISDPQTLEDIAFWLLGRVYDEAHPIRLLGIAVSNLNAPGADESDEDSLSSQLVLPLAQAH